MPTLLLALILLDTPPSPSKAPASPAPAASAKKRETLAEVAARRPASGKKAPPAKVLTNDDLEKARAGGAPVSVLAADEFTAGPARAGNPEASDELGSAESVPKDEASWRQRAEAARMRSTDAATAVSQAEQRLGELRSDVAPEDPMNPFRQQAREAEIKAEMERLEAARAEVGAARQAVSDLEEEARKAGIPPGWLREPPPL